MSTRCQIEFSINGERRTIYRHSDGYPDTEEGVLYSLREFLKWNKGRNDDIEYLAANFIYWSKKGTEADIKRWRKARWGGVFEDSYYEDILKTGFGICENDDLHGDIKYFYKVKLYHAEPMTYATVEVYEVEG